jgi:hypothetical protein
MNGYEHFRIAEDLALTQSLPTGPSAEPGSNSPQRRFMKPDANPDVLHLAMVHALLAIASYMPT